MVMILVFFCVIVEFVLALTGATMGTLIAFVFPSCLFLRAVSEKTNTRLIAKVGCWCNGLMRSWFKGNIHAFLSQLRSQEKFLWIKAVVIQMAAMSSVWFLLFHQWCGIGQNKGGPADITWNYSIFYQPVQSKLVANRLAEVAYRTLLFLVDR